MPIGIKLGEAAGVAGAAYGIAKDVFGINNKRDDRRQIEQQRKLSEQEAEIQNKAQLEMWNKTNYGAQMEHLEKAGLNPGLIYGMSGAGGATTGGGISGGQAASAAATKQADTASAGMGIQAGMMAAQLELIKAQTDKTRAEAAKTAGVDTGLAEANKASVEFQNNLNNSIGTDDMVSRYKWANQKIERENAKEMAEYEAWYATGFEGKATDDPNSPIAKAMKAGLQKSLEELKQAKLNNNATEAGNVVKQFEARLAEEGIHPHSPWWTKLVTDMLQKVGMVDMVKSAIR